MHLLRKSPMALMVSLGKHVVGVYSAPTTQEEVRVIEADPSRLRFHQASSGVSTTYGSSSAGIVSSRLTPSPGPAQFSNPGLAAWFSR
ncbi:hypothetical protein IW261DRAFT_1471319 [Armillaria novae-zelandiae]|uniref:Uncharacterized protein n=1 Tax=Armillaria novae-zelandiae TaxID=153914 RepID=A0AA39PD06_9AGAR|nr:hypothetical protein IW261DRAFT_1471319 [Armillaria novae-zelandiae]